MWQPVTLTENRRASPALQLNEGKRHICAEEQSLKTGVAEVPDSDLHFSGKRWR